MGNDSDDSTYRFSVAVRFAVLGIPAAKRADARIDVLPHGSLRGVVRGGVPRHAKREGAAARAACRTFVAHDRWIWQFRAARATER